MCTVSIPLYRLSGGTISDLLIRTSILVNVLYRQYTKHQYCRINRKCFFQWRLQGGFTRGGGVQNRAFWQLLQFGTPLYLFWKRTCFHGNLPSHSLRHTGIGLSLAQQKSEENSVERVLINVNAKFNSRLKTLSMKATNISRNAAWLTFTQHKYRPTVHIFKFLSIVKECCISFVFQNIVWVSQNHCVYTSWWS